ncbi:MAG: DUF2062 domain-containing protein [Synechococcales bacterium]|nr:DUF2062 domain-containing protein [Synechococcales bacterium]
MSQPQPDLSELTSASRMQSAQSSTQPSADLPFPGDGPPSLSSPKPSPASRLRPRSPWRRQLRYLYLRFIRLRGSSPAIARGLAAGVFAGWFPLFGLQTIIGIAIAAVVQGNKLIAAAGTWVSNPLTYVPIYFFNFRVGQRLLELAGVQSEMPDLSALQAIIDNANWQSFSEFLALGASFTAALFLGSFVVGCISAVVAYFLGLWLLNRLRRPASR